MKQIQGLSRLWLLLLGLCLISRPLESPDLWWDLARGREVAAGSLRPAQNLLLLDHASEASWLGGVPFYGLWSAGGIFALAAVPLMAAVLLMRQVNRAAGLSGGVLAAVVVTPLLVLAARSHLEPTAWLFDVIGLCGAWWIVRGPWGGGAPMPKIAASPNAAREPRSPGKRDAQTLRTGALPGAVWRAGLLFCVWANLGPCPLWGLLLIAVWPEAVPHRRIMLLAAVAGGMLTPRGALTWLDSMVLFAPTAFEWPAALEPRWRGLLSAGWSIDLAAGGVLWLLAAVQVVRTRRERSFADVAMLAVPLVSVLLSRFNLPPAALWTTFHWLAVSRRSEAMVTPRRPVWLRPGIAVVTAVVVLDACGLMAKGSRTLGWGLSQAIDPRLLSLPEFGHDGDPVTAWGADSRSAGVAAWASRSTRLVDHPIRALVGGRSAAQAGFRRDLISAHRSAYRLDDGSWGGWGRPFLEWDVEMLFLPAEDRELHRGLLETPWKVVKLDSPTVPYVSAENPKFDRAVVEVMLQQGFVEAGAWQPSMEVYDPQGWRMEASALLGLGPGSGPAIRQARFFRAIKLPMAAVRALNPMRAGGGTSAVRDEFLRCQAALALEEWQFAGEVSLLRRVMLDASAVVSEDDRPWEQGAPASERPLSKEWETCRGLYREGRVVEAAGALKGASGQEHYARGVLFLEAGDLDRARASLEAAGASGETGVRIAASRWLEQIGAGDMAWKAP